MQGQDKERVMMKFLQDDSGNNSSMRLAMFLLVVCVMIGWLYVTVRLQVVQDIPPGLVSIIIAAFAAKVWQKGTEAK